MTRYIPKVVYYKPFEWALKPGATAVVPMVKVGLSWGQGREGFTFTRIGIYG